MRSFIRPARCYPHHHNSLFNTPIRKFCFDLRPLVSSKLSRDYCRNQKGEGIRAHAASAPAPAPAPAQSLQYDTLKPFASARNFLSHFERLISKLRPLLERGKAFHQRQPISLIVHYNSSLFEIKFIAIDWA